MIRAGRSLLLILACACHLAWAEDYSGAPVPSPEADGPATVVQDAPVPALIEQHEVHRGIASWYGPRFHGRRTASGERFDQNALTAAHPWLPFGTRVRVRSLASGRTVDVRINDRGPHVRRRVIDLSRAAAAALGLHEPGGGTPPVAITLLRSP
jgi:rare lipoprotein A